MDVQDAGAADVLDSILTESHDHIETCRSTIKNLLFTLSKYPLDAPQLDWPLEQLAQSKILPVRKGSTTRLCAPADREWFTPDRLRFTNSFEGKLWLLDFEKTEMESINKLFVRLGLTGRALSERVTEETISEGQTKPHPYATKELQAKAPFIAM